MSTLALVSNTLVQAQRLEMMNQALELMELLAVSSSSEECRNQLDLLESSAEEMLPVYTEMYGEPHGQAYMDECKAILSARIALFV